MNAPVLNKAVVKGIKVDKLIIIDQNYFILIV